MHPENRIITAPMEYDGDMPSLFLAGGVPKENNWRQQVASQLGCSGWIFFDPTRTDWNPSKIVEYTAWEKKYLEKSWAALFWFSPETLCPMTIFELASVLPLAKPLFIGFDKDYKLFGELEARISHIRPWQVIHRDLDDLTHQAGEWLTNN